MNKILPIFVSIVAMSVSAIAADATSPDADNSKKNERDRSGETKTPIDQSNTPEDLEITKNIRQAVVKDESLSMTAKNVKIITAGGAVTLRGPVNTAEEKAVIDRHAKTAAGVSKVDNQIEVKAEDKK